MLRITTLYVTGEGAREACGALPQHPRGDSARCDRVSNQEYCHTRVPVPLETYPDCAALVQLRVRGAMSVVCSLLPCCSCSCVNSTCAIQVLVGFDVDCCSVAYDGTRVLVTPRAHNAIISQYNTLDMSRRSPSYEMRLAKYARRGFEVLVPNLQRDLINPQVMEAPFSKVHGMGRLLLLERFQDVEDQVRAG